MVMAGDKSSHPGTLKVQNVQRRSALGAIAAFHSPTECRSVSERSSVMDRPRTTAARWDTSTASGTQVPGTLRERKVVRGLRVLILSVALPLASGWPRLRRQQGTDCPWH
ncbi:hypothetical protein DPEC_G00152780 [Dallia pectoralis]|uniref:Uncharacterized protein n=1 Tax=Dallia pectoralis TaxID=75939 RepID=A0ACC2GJK3_DALPE|nr:hypothetical protein DPEC_G00152780 [Dallia pectoralis]